MKIDVCRRIPEHIETLIFINEEELSVQSSELINDDIIGSIRQFAQIENYKFEAGKVLSFTRLVNNKKQNIILCGLAKKAKLNFYNFRNHLASALREALRYKSKENYVYFGFEPGVGEVTLGHLLSETAHLVGYRFDKYQSQREENEPGNFHLIYQAKTNRSLNRGILEGKIYADATNLAKDLVNEPANVMNPEALAEQAKKAALQYGFSIEVHNHDKLKRLKMDAFLSVGRGSKNTPRLIIMRYNGTVDKKTPLTALVGKGLTFDSGGYNLKPGMSMLNMKTDMSGSAAVIGAMSAIAHLKLKVNVVGIIAAAENMIGSDAYRPGDILTSMSGKTIEVGNTDAEGRLTLIDAITYALEKEKADRVIDIATLTGAAAAALGQDFSVVLSNNDKLYDKLWAVAECSGERIWRMPLHEPYNEMIKSEIADLKNVGGPLAGSITAGLFIHQFVQDKPWIHIDIAGSASREKPSGVNGPGATGVGVRLLTNLIRNLD